MREDLVVSLGRTRENKEVKFNLSENGNILIAGPVGSGISTVINGILIELNEKFEEKDLVVTYIDSKVFDSKLPSKFGRNIVKNTLTPYFDTENYVTRNEEFESSIIRDIDSCIRIRTSRLINSDFVNYSELEKNNEYMQRVIFVIDDIMEYSDSVKQAIRRLIMHGRRLGIYVIGVTREPSFDKKILKYFDNRLVMKGSKTLIVNTLKEDLDSSKNVGEGYLRVLDSETVEVKFDKIDIAEGWKRVSQSKENKPIYINLNIDNGSNELCISKNNLMVCGKRDEDIMKYTVSLMKDLIENSYYRDRNIYFIGNSFKRSNFKNNISQDHNIIYEKKDFINNIVKKIKNRIESFTSAGLFDIESYRAKGHRISTDIVVIDNIDSYFEPQEDLLESLDYILKYGINFGVSVILLNKEEAFTNIVGRQIKNKVIVSTTGTASIELINYARADYKPLQINISSNIDEQLMYPLYRNCLQIRAKHREDYFDYASMIISDMKERYEKEELSLIFCSQDYSRGRYKNKDYIMNNCSLLPLESVKYILHRRLNIFKDKGVNDIKSYRELGYNMTNIVAILDDIFSNKNAKDFRDIDLIVRVGRSVGIRVISLSTSMPHYNNLFYDIKIENNYNEGLTVKIPDYLQNMLDENKTIAVKDKSSHTSNEPFRVINIEEVSKSINLNTNHLIIEGKDLDNILTCTNQIVKHISNNISFIGDKAIGMEIREGLENDLDYISKSNIKNIADFLNSRNSEPDNKEISNKLSTNTLIVDMVSSYIQPEDNLIEELDYIIDDSEISVILLTKQKPFVDTLGRKIENKITVLDSGEVCLETRSDKVKENENIIININTDVNSPINYQFSRFHLQVRSEYKEHYYDYACMLLDDIKDRCKSDDISLVYCSNDFSRGTYKIKDTIMDECSLLSVDSVRYLMDKRFKELRDKDVCNIREYRKLGYNMDTIVLIVDDVLNNTKNSKDMKNIDLVLRLGRAVGFRIISLSPFTNERTAFTFCLDLEYEEGRGLVIKPDELLEDYISKNRNTI